MDGCQFEDLYRRTYAQVLGFAMRRTSRDLAEDAAAATFLVAWRRRDDIVGDPLPWLLGIARRVLANQHRSARRTQALGMRVAAVPPSDDGHPDVDIPDSRVAIALRSLRPRDRETLTLIVWDELSPAQAARVVGCSATTFRVRLHRAKKRFANALADSDLRGRTRTRKAPATTLETRG
jgi:RNA polymerase sigma factor (sigma-70 family)